MKKLSLLILGLFAWMLSFSQVDVNQFFTQHPEVVIKFQIQDESQLETLTRMLSIDKVTGNEVIAYAVQEEFEHFLTLNIPYEIVERPVSTPEEANMKDFEGMRNSRDWDAYPTYGAYEAMMYQFETDYPDICRVVQFGTTIQNRKLLACVLSDNVGVREAEPQIFYSSTMHGDEIVGYVLMLRLIDSLLISYGTSPQVTNLLDNAEIWICPLANPDGTYWGGDNSNIRTASRRNNAANVDLNRNYKNWIFGAHPDGKSYQPETLSFMALQEDEAFVSGVNFHGGEEVFNFTWDATCILPADYDWWILVGKEYVDAVHLYSPSNYMNGIFCSCTNPPSPVCYPGLCNGKSWYIAEGTRQDYTNYDDHTREFTLEIGPKTPQASTLPSYWNYNRRSFLNFMDQALYGIHGVVTDAATGDSIFAKIFVENHDADNSYVMTDPRVGYYARPIKGGTYNVTYSAAGYISQTINITVADYQKVIQNVALMPETPPALPPIANFSFDTKLITTGVPTEVHFEDRSLNLPTSWQWYFEGGDPETSTEKNPVVTYLIEDLAKIQTIKVELTAINAHGEDTKEDFLTVGASPTSDFTAEPTTLIAGNNVSFFDITANDPETWKWTFEGGDPETSTEQNPVVIYRHPGKYTVTLTTKNIFGANSHTKENYITVLETELPIADFYADTTCIFVGESIHFTSLSENAVTWEWYFEGGTPDTSDEENPTVVYEKEGNFDVKLTVTNAEGEDEMLKEKYICVKEKESIDEVNGLKIKVFPNPVSQGATVTIDADSPVRKIEWLNMAGALIKTIYADAASCTFSVSGIDAGFYLMKIETEKGVSVTKIQVQ